MDNSIENLMEYISTCRTQGYSDQQIQEVLLNSEWPKGIIQEAFVLSDWGNTSDKIPQKTILPIQEDVKATSLTPLPAEVTKPQKTKSKKFGVMQANIDSFKSLKTNIKAFILSLLIVLATGVFLMILSALVISVIESNSNSFIGIMIFLIFSYISTVVFFSLQTSVGAITVFRGPNGQKTTIKQTFSVAIKALPRVSKAYAVIFLLAILPIIISIFISVNLEESGQIFAIMAYGFSAVWIVFLMLKFSLAPFSALFEPNLKSIQTLSRSKDLLPGQGILFLARYYMIIFLISVILMLILGMRPNDSSAIYGPWWIVILLAQIWSTGPLTMLYRHLVSKEANLAN